jgi:Fe-S oxidoreductase/nitrate reductase gamma subunit
MLLPPPAELPIAAAAPLTREIFGNIPGWAQFVFYLLAAASVAAWSYGIVRRVRLWRQGRRGGPPISVALVCQRLFRDVLLQRRLRLRRPFASLAHKLLFIGFFVLLVGTTLVAIEHVLTDLLGRDPSNPVFHKGVYFGVYEVMMDAFGVAFLVGCTMLLARRLRGRGSFARTPADVGILVLLIVIGVTGYVVEGLRIVLADTPLPGLSPVGFIAAQLFRGAGLDATSAATWHFTLWWGHAALALGFIALMPYTRLLHSLAGTINLAIRDHALGVMTPISMEEVEATGQIGVAKMADFSLRQLVELDACVSCGRCEDACPAFEAGKPLSPRNVVQDLVQLLNVAGGAGEMHGDVISADTLWSCTTCGACPTVCPLGLSPMRMITDMRRNLIGEGALRGSPATALQKSDRVGNPWGLAQAERLGWTAGLDVPTVATNPDFEILYWVGCAAAYDRRVQKIARSTVRLLQAAQVNFAVLGPEERCTGEAARRMGDELLFRQLAEQNVETLSQHKVRRIVAHCPHCVNSFRNDYSQLGGQYEVVHHSQLLEELVRDGRLTPNHDGADTGDGGSITFHDPCYLARSLGETEAPRAVLAASSAGAAHALPVIELSRNRANTSCCGGGGGRMWFDDAPAQRIGQGRVREIAATDADTVAVSCPFCLIMIGDGMAAERPEMQVKDISDLLAAATLGPEK